MTPQLVDHARSDSCIVIGSAGCNLAENEHVYFWLQSHHSHNCEERFRAPAHQSIQTRYLLSVCFAAFVTK